MRLVDDKTGKHPAHDGHNGTPLLGKTVPAVRTAEMNSEQRSARIDTLVIEVAELKAALSLAVGTIAAQTERLNRHQADIVGTIARLNETESQLLFLAAKFPQTRWQRLMWIVRG